MTPAGLQTAIGYQFQSPALLEQALTHRSCGGSNNERLEFLGDGLLNAVIGSALYACRPRDDEGALSRLRASLVREATLAGIARGFELGSLLRLGESERKTGGHRRDSILSDALEALLGAIWLDGGFEAAQRCCLDWFAARLQALPDPESLKDPKTRLQEWLQGQGLALPGYQVLAADGPPHRRRFTVRCTLAGDPRHAEAEAGSRREAEQRAARLLLEQLGVVMRPVPQENGDA
ncbi:ribonuclease III [Flagellatimonas centrodinii]|uniref:ribonuclease III n=1 Tax=Flagellatimonas centrodinii TaxID=2806210 RepID=UPI001FFD0AB1|nr:ribonuclease III [Flagellatimonas centrodinii]ULQ46572.1 ribonuclease III [Flagellatimonas centrodinii]